MADLHARFCCCCRSRCCFVAVVVVVIVVVAGVVVVVVVIIIAAVVVVVVAAAGVVMLELKILKQPACVQRILTTQRPISVHFRRHTKDPSVKKNYRTTIKDHRHP